MPGSKRGRTVVNSDAPKPDLHFDSRPSTKAQKSSRRHLRTKTLLAKLFAGSLVNLKYKAEQQEIEQHIRVCSSCRSLCIRQAHRDVAMPFLRTVATDYGMTLPELQRRLLKAAITRMKLNSF
jgi:hypothetical protein